MTYIHDVAAPTSATCTLFDDSDFRAQYAVREVAFRVHFWRPVEYIGARMPTDYVSMRTRSRCGTQFSETSHGA
jgi:hypothetical protein